MKQEKWTFSNIPDLSGKVIVVTGGNSGVGYESVKAFAGKGASVILASRSVERGKTAESEILMKNPEAKIEVMQLDLADFASIRNFAENFKQKYDRLDVLLNNAGIMTTPYFLTKDGLEGQNGTNHFGHFALTGLLLDKLRNTKNARIVNVSSIAHKQGKINFSNFLFEGGKGYSPLKSYGQSKLANLLFTYELQRKFELHKISAIAVAAHPGVSATKIARYIENKLYYKLLYPLATPFIQNQQKGALPLIRASVDHAVKGGEYYGPDGFMEMKGFPVLVYSNRASENKEDAKKLWELSENLTGIKYL